MAEYKMMMSQIPYHPYDLIEASLGVTPYTYGLFIDKVLCILIRTTLCKQVYST
jgi:hypothetical protein